MIDQTVIDGILVSLGAFYTRWHTRSAVSRGPVPLRSTITLQHPRSAMHPGNCIYRRYADRPECIDTEEVAELPTDVSLLLTLEVIPKHSGHEIESCHMPQGTNILRRAAFFPTPKAAAVEASIQVPQGPSSASLPGIIPQTSAIPSDQHAYFRTGWNGSALVLYMQACVRTGAITLMHVVILQHTSLDLHSSFVALPLLLQSASLLQRLLPAGRRAGPSTVSYQGTVYSTNRSLQWTSEPCGDLHTPSRIACEIRKGSNR
jgi:hypothetical protein